MKTAITADINEGISSRATEIGQMEYEPGDLAPGSKA
jgi:hypothetical protein